ncbi:reverse transcriptase domain-containing protein, partial [Tanacetum coccineum]
KNAGATYQQLVDKAFDNQVSRNIEVYVDDLVIKSHTEAEMLRDIDETFRTFLSKSAEKSLPLFKTLKRCIKKSDFHWTPDAKQAFKQLKQHLSELPLLVAPKPKEELIVYLSASHRAISTVLMTKSGMVQSPVYFVVEILADFLVEKPDDSPPDTSVVETPQELWTLFTDGSSFQFTASNNEAEYEALIAGLQIAAQMGVRNVHLCALIQTGLGRNTERKIHTKEEGDDRGKGGWTNMDDTNKEYLKEGTLLDDKK